MYKISFKIFFFLKKGSLLKNKPFLMNKKIYFLFTNFYQMTMVKWMIYSILFLEKSVFYVIFAFAIFFNPLSIINNFKKQNNIYF